MGPTSALAKCLLLVFLSAEHDTVGVGGVLSLSGPEWQNVASSCLPGNFVLCFYSELSIAVSALSSCFPLLSVNLSLMVGARVLMSFRVDTKGLGPVFLSFLPFFLVFFD